MNTRGSEINPQERSTAEVYNARLLLRFAQLAFLFVLLAQLDAPFLSAHNERQNQTYDMSRHIFREGWHSILVPRVTFSLPGHADSSVTPVTLEVPFHGILGWPLVKLTGHDRAAVRVVSAAFGLFSIQVLFWILRCWLPALPSALGAALWATAPLVLHFGQVPMPDIVCSAGMLAAFYFALRGKSTWSASWFLFALVAKMSVIVYGLPILTGLLVARDCRSWRQLLRISLVWGWIPVAGLAACAVVIHLFAPPSFDMSVTNVLTERGNWTGLLHAPFYKLALGCLLPFGFGLVGSLGLVLALRTGLPGMDRRIKWAIVASNVIYLLGVLRKVPEPQYLVPVLAWCVIASSFGLSILVEKYRVSRTWKVGLGLAVAVHLAVATFFCIDLKTSRVPNYTDIVRAGELLPPNARVIAFYRFYGASPAVWLDRNVLPVGSVEALDSQVEYLEKLGFTHIMILDIESLHNKGSDNALTTLVSRVVRALQGKPGTSPVNLPGFTDPDGPPRRYCDSHFSRLFVAPHVVLYSLTPPKAP